MVFESGDGSGLRCSSSRSGSCGLDDARRERCARVMGHQGVKPSSEGFGGAGARHASISQGYNLCTFGTRHWAPEGGKGGRKSKWIGQVSRIMSKSI